MLTFSVFFLLLLLTQIYDLRWFCQLVQALTILRLRVAFVAQLVELLPLILETCASHPNMGKI